MDVITSCVKRSIGGTQWELARQAREKSLEEYLEAKEAYDKNEIQIAREKS